MAYIKFGGIEQYQKQLAKLGERAEGICKSALYEGAAVLADAVRSEYAKYDHPDSKGDLMDSLALTPMKNDGGFINTRIKFAGYDQNGTPNALKAAVLEGGTSTVQAKPFIRAAASKAKKQAEAAIKAKLEDNLEKAMNS